MKYTARTRTGSVEVDLQLAVLDDVRAVVEGRAYRLSLEEIEPNVFRVFRGGPTLEIQVARLDGGYEVRFGKQRLMIEILDRRVTLAGSSAGGGSGRSEVRAPMPGKVVRLLVEEGTRVDKDAGLLVVEAMKMQNEIRAFGSGTVERIAVSVGQAVDAGDLLVVVESPEDS